jgi:hypothetical protein
MTDEAEPRLFVNRWGDVSDPAPGRRGSYRDICSCFDQSRPHPRARVGFHVERQDTSAPGWQHLLDLVDEAVADGREEFRPLTELSPEERRQVITLPPSIARLTAVKHLVLYGSNLVRIPPEIGAMASLEEFTPYTFYRLHWFPYEITRCRKLTRGTVSTRAFVRQLQAATALPEASTRSGLRRGPRSGHHGPSPPGRHRHPQLQRLRPPGRAGRTPTSVDFAARCHGRTAPASQRLLIGVCRRAA